MAVERTSPRGRMDILAAVAALVLVLLFAGTAQAGSTGPPHAFFRLGDLQLYGDSPDYLDLGIGAFDFYGEGKSRTSGAIRAEWRFGKKLLFVGPALGLMANLDGGLFGYGGLYADLAYKRLTLTPLAGAGGYIRGHSKDLGGTFQFRVAATLAYQLNDFSRVGIGAAHISNLDIHPSNQGEEEIYLLFAFPF